MEESVLKCENLCKKFGKKQILKNVSLELKQGDILGFIGPNGAGKTTTIKLILGLQSIDSGSVTIKGYNIQKEFEKAIGKEKIAKTSPLMISEDFSFYQKEVPGLFFMLGARNEEKGYVNALHNLNFNFNEDILINGLKIYETLLKYKKSIV